MLLMVLLAVFIAGLMVGRTPEYLGKKVEAREVKLVLVGVLVVPLLVLVATALATATDYGTKSIFNPGPAWLRGDAVRLHLAGQQQRLRVRGLHGLHPAERARQRRRRHDHVRRTCWAAARCSWAASCRCWRRSPWPARWPASASRPLGAGTFRTDTPTFVFLLVFVIIVVAALTFFPALLLGPIVEALTTQLF